VAEAGTRSHPADRAQYAVRECAQGDCDASIDQQRQLALEEWPEFAEAHYGLGEALEARGESEDAIRHYRRAASVKPDFALAHFRLGNLLAKGVTRRLR